MHSELEFREFVKLWLRAFPLELLAQIRVDRRTFPHPSSGRIKVTYGINKQ